MACLDAQEYEKLASEIVHDYFTNKTPLADGILKKANELGLNPDQINQLVWQANTKTHLELFEKKSEDKNIEFPLADTKYVLANLYSEDAPSTEHAENKDIKDALTDFYTSVAKPAEKTAAEETVTTPETLPLNRSKEILTMRKVASEIELKALEHRETYRTKIATLHTYARRIANDPRIDPETLPQYELDALGMCGNSIKPVLKDAGLKSHESFPENYKVANVIDDSTEFFTHLYAAKNEFDAAIKYTKGLVFLREKLNHILCSNTLI